MDHPAIDELIQVFSLYDEHTKRRLNAWVDRWIICCSGEMDIPEPKDPEEIARAYAAMFSTLMFEKLSKLMQTKNVNREGKNFRIGMQVHCLNRVPRPILRAVK